MLNFNQNHTKQQENLEQQSRVRSCSLLFPPDYIQSHNFPEGWDRSTYSKSPLTPVSHNVIGVRSGRAVAQIIHRERIPVIITAAEI